MRDFTYKIYEALLQEYINKNYKLCSYENFLENTPNGRKTVILRHDVDKQPENSLQTAKLENKHGATGTYYFRIVKESFQENYIKQIVDLGHEIGYHYEDLTLCKGNFDQAIDHFERSLNRVRKFYQVKTICMHGSPMSKWDNKLLWEKYKYQDYGILAEPYFDLDFNNVFYITDTGRQWNRSGVSVRDKVQSNFKIDVKSTRDVIESISAEKFPRIVMQNIHPQRWNDNYGEWLTELIFQNVKNVVKSALIKIRSR